MFVDYISIKIASGDGGKGCVSFRREKFVAKGSPNGGDGGRGGDVIFVGDRNLHTLLDFRYHREIFAEHGKPGQKNEMTGKSGKHQFIKVPLGTVVKNAKTGDILADLTEDQQRIKVLTGGKGGLGNVHFKTSTKQAPTYAQPGLPGESCEVDLELKVMADVGLVGFPNAGKSTLLSVVSNAKPKIAGYPFTTLVPNLGIVKYETFKSFVMADIPGLIEGASKGKGLGHQFLRHVERTRVLVYMIPADCEDYEKEFNILRNEVEVFNDFMEKKPIVKVLTKADLLEEDRDTSFFDLKICSIAHQGLDELKKLIANKLYELSEDAPLKWE